MMRLILALWCVVLLSACHTDYSDTFTRYDTDHDGEWTHAEYWAAEGARYGEKGWHEMDADGDGVVTRFEYYRFPNESHE